MAREQRLLPLSKKGDDDACLARWRSTSDQGRFRRAACARGGGTFARARAVGVRPAASADVGCFGARRSEHVRHAERGEPPQPRERPHAGAEGRARARPGETTDPLTGCGNTGQPNAFPVINPGATGAALVAGCVGQAGVNNGVKSLGIPPLRQTDGPAGVRLSHQETGLPAPVGLTATFDRDAANAYGSVIGREGRATNQDVLYAPMINQVAFPTAGRNFETLGEDPYLAGELVARRDPRRAERGADRDAQAHGDERLRELADEHRDQARRADAARARAAGLREGDRGGPRRLDHVRLQPHQPVGHRPRHLLVRQQPAAQRRSRAARSASRAGC